MSGEREPVADLAGEALPGERRIEAAIRPHSLDEFVGQDRLRDNLRVFASAARQRGESLDHLLLCGPPGLGKTALAHVMSREMQAPLRATSGPVLERAGDLAALLSNLESGDVLFIDEIHRMPAAVEEILYPAMEDFQLDLLIGAGPSARSIRLDLPPFTLVGATTRASLVSAPLRDRFGWVGRLEYYPASDLARILERCAVRLQLAIAPEACFEIARRARGTPRIALRLLRRVRDFADAERAQAAAGRPPTRTADVGGGVDCDLTRYALERLDVDEAGFDRLDRALLLTILEKFDGGPVGLETLAAALGEDKGTLEDLVEPFLIQGGFLDRTPRGRVATRLAFEHFDLPRRDGGGSQGRLL